MKTSLVAAVAAFAALAQPAAARVFTMTYTGTVSPGGYDAAGLFGASGADLSGASFSAAFTVDDATPGAENYAGSLGGYTDYSMTYIRGGSNYGPGATPVTATLTINGTSFAVAANASSIAQRIEGYHPGFNGYDAVLNYVSGNGQSLFIQLYADGASGAPDFIQNPDYRGGLDFNVAPQIAQTASFSVFVNGDPYHVSTGQLNVSHLSVSEVVPVPEPGEWAMMLAGLTLVGGIAKRRRG